MNSDDGAIHEPCGIPTKKIRKGHIIITVLLFGLIVSSTLLPVHVAHILFLSVTFISTVLVSQDMPRVRQAVMILGLLVVVGIAGLDYVAQYVVKELLMPAIISLLVTVLFFLAYCVGLILVQLLKMEDVSSNELFATVNLYLILGMAWAYAYMLVQACDPASFDLRDGTPLKGLHMVYFSFVTLTTLGFGDITPRSEIAQLLVVTEAIVGNLYVAVVIAYLLSVHIDRRSKPEAGTSSSVSTHERKRTGRNRFQGSDEGC